MTDYNNLLDPQIIQVNKEKPRVESPSFKDMDQLADYIQDNTFGYHKLEALKWPNKLMLNGTWKFKLCKNMNQIPADFYKSAYDNEVWDDIKVPGVWQLQGYHLEDKPYYLAFDYPPVINKKRIPDINQDENSVGCYSKVAKIPTEMLLDDQCIMIHFGGVKSAFYLYVNDVEVGYSQGSMTPAEFDITKYLHEGDNKISTLVFRYSDGTYLEDQDMWFLSGMYRDVYMYTEPVCYIEDYFIRTRQYESSESDEESIKAMSNPWKIKVSITVKNRKNIAFPCKVNVDLGNFGLMKARFVVDLLDSETVTVDMIVDNPNLWSAEKPSLYPLIIALSSHHGDLLQVKQHLVGFRQVVIENGVLLFNGKPLTFHGVNRHEFDSRFGHAVPKEVIRDDLLQMKRLNINAIRTSHYPNSPYFYHLCDQLGFYVIDEADLETHGVRKKLPKGLSEWKEACLDRMVRMVMRDRNHPCIVMWSLGNEAGFGDNFKHMKEAAKKLDRTRPFHYEGDTSLKVSDVFSRMYASPDFIHQTGRGEAIGTGFIKRILNRLAQNNRAYKVEDYALKPIMFCEFAHAMENSLGNFREHVDAWYEYEAWCGGFIWDYVDQSIEMKEDGVTKYLYGGDFEEEISHRYFNANGIIGGDRRPHPSAYEVKKVYQMMKVQDLDCDKGLLRIHNRHLFKDLDEFLWTFELLEDGAIIQEGEIEKRSIKGLETLDVQVELKEFLKVEGALYHLNIYFKQIGDNYYAKDGFVQGMEQFTLNTVGHKVFRLSQNSRVNVQDRQLKIDVEGQDFSMSFSKTSGNLISYKIKNSEVLRKPMRLNLWRAETDNDRSLSNFKPKYRWFFVNTLYKKAMESYKVSNYTCDEDLPGVVIKFNRKVSGVKGFVETIYKVDGDGNLEVLLSMTPKKDLIRFGSTMGIREDWSEFLYFGRGPQENYVDRNYGAHMGIYESNIRDFMHSYMRPQENGNHCDVQWFVAEDKDQEGIIIENLGEKSLSVSAWPYTQEELDLKEHSHELEKAGFITLNIDYGQRGVGGDYPGMLSLLDEYKLKAKRKYQYNFRILRND